MEVKTYDCYINGEWIKKTSGDKIDVENPAKGEIFASINCSTIEETQHALKPLRRHSLHGRWFQPANGHNTSIKSRTSFNRKKNILHELW